VGGNFPAPLFIDKFNITSRGSDEISKSIPSNWIILTYILETIKHITISVIYDVMHAAVAGDDGHAIRRQLESEPTIHVCFVSLDDFIVEEAGSRHSVR
jgi:hypothetical protein